MIWEGKSDNLRWSETVKKRKTGKKESNKPKGPEKSIHKVKTPQKEKENRNAVEVTSIAHDESDQTNSTNARFIEDDQVIEMGVTAEEQDDFNDEEYESEMKETAISPEILNSANNNATIARTVNLDEEIEEGQIIAENEPRPRTSGYRLLQQASRGMNEKEKEEVIGETLARVQQMMDKASLICQHFSVNTEKETSQDKRKGKNPRKNDVPKVVPQLSDSMSDLTVYKNAVECDVGKRGSTSSEDNISPDTSGELNEIIEREKSNLRQPRKISDPE